MVKKKKTKRKKMSEEWKRLRTAHRRGPKRVKIPIERRKNGVDPILTPEHSRRVQIMFEDKDSDKYVSVIVLKSVFERMGLHCGDDIQTKEGNLHRAAFRLRKTFDVLQHNDRVLNTPKLVKFDSYVRRAWVFGNPFREYDAIIRICESDEKRASREKIRRHLDQLFGPAASVCSEKREYI